MIWIHVIPDDLIILSGYLFLPSSEHGKAHLSDRPHSKAHNARPAKLQLTGTRT